MHRRSAHRTLALASLLLLATPGCADKTPPPNSARPKGAQPRAALAKTATKVAAKQPLKVAGAALAIAKSYTGRVRLAMKMPGAKAEASGGQVLRDQASYEAFIKRIPTKRVTKRRPAPPSDDPLLKRPAVDFGKQMVIVFDRDDMYVGPQIVRVVAKGSGAVVKVVLPDPGKSAMMARVMDVGTYHAVVVPKVSGEVSFEVTAGPKKPE